MKNLINKKRLQANWWKRKAWGIDSYHEGTWWVNIGRLQIIIDFTR